MEPSQPKTEPSKEPKPDLSEFERQYFIQTRHEIDTEKQERNKILNYAIVAIGAVTLAIGKVDNPTGLLRSPMALCLCYPALLLIYVLVAARRAKLQQIFDRWFVLHDILISRGQPKGWAPLEQTVCKGYDTGRYLVEDRLMYAGLSLFPIALTALAVSKLHPILALPAFLIPTGLCVRLYWQLKRNVPQPNTAPQTQAPTTPPNPPPETAVSAPTQNAAQGSKQ